MICKEYKNVNSINKFISIIEKIAKSCGGLWFRGHNNERYSLVPSLYRHPSVLNTLDLIQLESELIERFQERAIPFLSKNLDSMNLWDQLFVMQHHGIPTRLLDWTENPFIALFFALSENEYDIVKGKKQYKNDAAVWILNPYNWNKSIVPVTSEKTRILSVNRENSLTRYLKPNTKFNQLWQYPAAIYGNHNNNRIIAQRGVFILFGKSKNPMESYDYSKKSLFKIVISKDSIDDLLVSLSTLGFADSVIYPDLDGFASELKKKFKFK